MENEAAQIDLFYRFGAALVIGLLVGLQREYAHFRENGENRLFAGTRTFALMSLLGCTAAFMADLSGSPLAFVALLLVAGALVTVAYYLSAHAGSMGLTTEVAALIIVLAGALCYWDQLALAAALAVATTVLLALKLQTQTLVRNITREDVYATLTFAVITVVVLPVLPRQSFGPPPFDVLVPYKIWLMVVFISGISFLGYVLIKIVGARRGVGLTGLLGGLASSTAVTLSFSQRSRTLEGFAKPFALAILLAWSVMFVRVMVEVAALNGPLLRIVWIPMTAGTLVSFAYCGYLYFSQGLEKQEEQDDFKNPFELGPALTFGLIYAVILLAANAAQMYLGNTGVYLSSIASGLADVDAITLSMAELSKEGGDLDLHTAARAIVLAAASNTVVKGGIVLSAGSVALRKVILPGLIATLATAIGVVFLL
ncbi:MAG: MgtC/SapB family protein [Rhodothermales bacterium]